MSRLDVESQPVLPSPPRPASVPVPDRPLREVQHTETTGSFREVWRARELLAILVWRDVTVRFRQTVVGIAWAMLQPMLLTAVFSILLANYVGGDPVIPYPIYVYSGILAWNFFSNSVVNAGMSVVNAENLIGKVYFPRLLLPLSAVGGTLVEFAIGAVGLVILIFYYRISPGWQVLLFPPAMVAIAITAFSVGTLLAALNVLYRDVRHVIPFLMQVWFFCTPGVFVQMKETPLEMLQNAPTFLGKVRALLTLANPINGLIDFFRSAALGMPLPWLAGTFSLLVITCGTFASWHYFRRVERRFVDVI